MKIGKIKQKEQLRSEILPILKKKVREFDKNQKEIIKSISILE